MALLKIEFEANWEPRKMGMATQRIRLLLSELRGVSNLGKLEIVEVGKEPPKGPELKPFFCSNKQFGKACGATWQAEIFQDCPKCGQRRFVKKGMPLTEEDVEAIG